ncbi:MAG: hypothetical protein NC548_48575 [Lachnospiraceae bacterium]|nr:hypothetical protein [Bacteroides sp.]MCM1222351.1 hypothetical protein [Lachnospiraceae bacterium]
MRLRLIHISKSRIAMNEKLLTVLKSKCEKFGLTPKALEELATLGSNGLADDASDEDISAKADSLVPFAKAMQGEITRKTRKPSAKPSKQSSKKEDEEGDGEGEEDDETPAWAKKLNERLEALETENKTLKAEKTAAERASLIAEKSKKLGIPDFVMKRLHIADDADIDKVLSEFKQDLVNNNLVAKDQTHEFGTTDDEAKAAAQAWAKSLPDKV